MKKILVIAIALTFVATTAFAGHNAAHKLAIHVKAHPTSCTKAYPTITDCTEIVTTWAQCGDFDAMPVFFNLSDYTVVEFALTWPAEWGSTSWVRCKGELAVGGILYAGEGTAIAWTTCQYGWSMLPGYAWLAATGPGMVQAIPNPATAMYGTVDCSDPFEYDFPLGVFAAGICHPPF
jgi:hypothetical protein